MDVKVAPLVPFAAGFTTMLAVGGSSLTSVSLDWDEGATLSAVTRSTREILLLAEHRDAVLTPYYLALHVVVRLLGESDAVLRLPSLLAMALGAGAVAELGRRINGPATGILAGVFCAIMPRLGLLANSARPYALAFLFATLATLCLLAAVRTPSWPRWAGYGACVFLTGLFHLVSLAVVAAHVVIWAAHWWRSRDRNLWRGVPPTAAALLALAPLMWIGAGQRDRQLHWVAEPTWKTIATLPGDIVLSAPVGFILLGLAVAAFIALPLWTYLDLLALAVVPVAAVMAVSFVVGPVWVPRYGIFLIAPVAVLAAATVTSERIRSVAVPPVGRAVAAAAAVALLVFLAWPAHASVRSTHNSPDLRGLATVIHQNAARGDVVVYASFAWSMRPNLTHYLNELEWNSAPQPPDVLVKVPAARNGTLEATEFLDLAGRLAGADRIWLIGPAAGSYGTPEDPLQQAGGKIGFIRKLYQVQRTWTVQDGRAALLIRNAGATR